jgi:hypothetical protein
MKDIGGREIQEGTKLERAVDGKAAATGHKYLVIKRMWSDDDPVASLVADGGFVSELLNMEVAKEFRGLE